ncbi:MAG: hypothetical protein E6G79_13455 [Alphaproteobacteria bacterium]|nr:MAG: hypothetical protein E6G79_13455 [Alphaproteobacteria bacterium]
MFSRTRPLLERCVMMNSPTTYLTKEEFQEIAAAKFEEAATLPPGYQKQEILRSAENFRRLAEMNGWLSSELRAPK